MKYKKTIPLIACALFTAFTLCIAAFPQEILAQATGETGIKELQRNLGSFAETTGIGNANEEADDFKDRIADVINIVLGFLGIIAVVFVMAGGFKWISAGGNSEQVEEAQSNIKNAVIGLAVVLASFIIINFAINQLGRATRVQQGAGQNDNNNTRD